jgi:general secretion pathway protein D
VDDPGAAVVVNQIEPRDTGVILSVVPRVSEGGMATLEIAREADDVVPTTSSGIDSPTIRQRRVATTVAVGDGETLAPGGLVQRRSGRSRSRVPWLGDVPGLGALFRPPATFEGSDGAAWC